MYPEFYDFISWNVHRLLALLEAGLELEAKQDAATRDQQAQIKKQIDEVIVALHRVAIEYLECLLYVSLLDEAKREQQLEEMVESLLEILTIRDREAEALKTKLTRWVESNSVVYTPIVIFPVFSSETIPLNNLGADTVGFNQVTPLELRALLSQFHIEVDDSADVTTCLQAFDEHLRAQGVPESKVYPMTQAILNVASPRCVAVMRQLDKALGNATDDSVQMSDVKYQVSYDAKKKTCELQGEAKLQPKAATAATYQHDNTASISVEVRPQQCQIQTVAFKISDPLLDVNQIEAVKVKVSNPLLDTSQPEAVESNVNDPRLEIKQLQTQLIQAKSTQEVRNILSKAAASTSSLVREYLFKNIGGGLLFDATAVAAGQVVDYITKVRAAIYSPGGQKWREDFIDKHRGDLGGIRAGYALKDIGGDYSLKARNALENTIKIMKRAGRNITKEQWQLFYQQWLALVLSDDKKDKQAAQDASNRYVNDIDPDIKFYSQAVAMNPGAVVDWTKNLVDQYLAEKTHDVMARLFDAYDHEKSLATAITLQKALLQRFLTGAEDTVLDQRLITYFNGLFAKDVKNGSRHAMRFLMHLVRGYQEISDAKVKGIVKARMTQLMDNLSVSQLVQFRGEIHNDLKPGYDELVFSSHKAAEILSKIAAHDIAADDKNVLLLNAALNIPSISTIAHNEAIQLVAKYFNGSSSLVGKTQIIKTLLSDYKSLSDYNKDRIANAQNAVVTMLERFELSGQVVSIAKDLPEDQQVIYFGHLFLGNQALSAAKEVVDFIQSAKDDTEAKARDSFLLMLMKEPSQYFIRYVFTTYQASHPNEAKLLINRMRELVKQQIVAAYPQWNHPQTGFNAWKQKQLADLGLRTGNSSSGKTMQPLIYRLALNKPIFTRARAGALVEKVLSPTDQASHRDRLPSEINTDVFSKHTRGTNGYYFAEARYIRREVLKVDGGILAPWLTAFIGLGDEAIQDMAAREKLLNDSNMVASGIVNPLAYLRMLIAALQAESYAMGLDLDPGFAWDGSFELFAGNRMEAESITLSFKFSPDKIPLFKVSYAQKVGDEDRIYAVQVQLPGDTTDTATKEKAFCCLFIVLQVAILRQEEIKPTCEVALADGVTFDEMLKPFIIGCYRLYEQLKLTRGDKAPQQLLRDILEAQPDYAAALGGSAEQLLERIFPVNEVASHEEAEKSSAVTELVFNPAHEDIYRAVESYWADRASVASLDDFLATHQKPKPVPASSATDAAGVGPDNLRPTAVFKA